MNAIALLKDVARPAYHGAQTIARRAKGLNALSKARRNLRKHWPHLITELAATDEMLIHGTALRKDRRQAIAEYFHVGDMLLGDLRRALERNGLPLEQVRSVLDFACGHGRVTRYMVATYGADRVTASDIDTQAVEFVRRTFGVSAFNSTRDADELEHRRRYQVIFVASLFSHLTLEHWRKWASKLVGMLQPGGLLVFSTHGIERYESMRPHIQSRFGKIEEGFIYNGTNETKGRLAGEYYGTAFVDEAFVRRFFSQEPGAAVVDYMPQGLGQNQDLYVVRESALYGPEVEVTGPRPADQPEQ